MVLYSHRNCDSKPKNFVFYKYNNIFNNKINELCNNKKTTTTITAISTTPIGSRTAYYTIKQNI